MKRISVFLTEEQIIGLQQYAKATGLKLAEVLRRIIDAALEQKRHTRES